MFEVGQKVVLVDVSRRGKGVSPSYAGRPVKNGVYVVSEIIPPLYASWTVQIGLIGFPAETVDGVRVGYFADRFRPLEENQFTESMSLLRKLAEPNSTIKIPETV